MDGLSLIIPAHNSEKVIENSLIQYNETFSKKFKNFEMIVVCNDSSDKTAEICRKLSSNLPIKTIEIPQRGKGYALVSGFHQAKFDFFGFLDADNPFDLGKILNMLNYLDANSVVIVSKYLKGTRKKQDFLSRRLLSIGGSIISRFIFNLSFRDTQAGAKFFKKEVWEKITKYKKTFICTGFDWDIEFLSRVKKNKFNVAEIYVPVNYGKFSTFRLKYVPGILKRLFIFRFIK